MKVGSALAHEGPDLRGQMLSLISDPLQGGTEETGGSQISRASSAK